MIISFAEEKEELPILLEKKGLVAVSKVKVKDNKIKLKFRHINPKHEDKLYIKDNPCINDITFLEVDDKKINTTINYYNFGYPDKNKVRIKFKPKFLSLVNLFYGCTEIIEDDFNDLDTNEVSNLNYLFFSTLN